jgi:hypothetical protein
MCYRFGNGYQRCKNEIRDKQGINDGFNFMGDVYSFRTVHQITADTKECGQGIDYVKAIGYDRSSCKIDFCMKEQDGQHTETF